MSLKTQESGATHYLSSKEQTVDINGTFSDLFEILEMGLFQGSSLSCLLFIIYVNYFFQTNKFSLQPLPPTQMWHQNVKTLIFLQTQKIKKINFFVHNILAIIFEKTNTILILIHTYIEL